MSSISDHNPIHAMKVPIIDLSHRSRQDFYERSLVIKEIHEACQNSGVFHVKISFKYAYFWQDMHAYF